MKFIKYLVVGIIVSICFYNCKKTNNTALVVHILAEPNDLHPTNGSSALRSEINLYTHLSLLRLDYKSGNPTPCLLKQFPKVSNDNLHFIYELKNNIFWDDNSAITIKDVAFTIKANMCLLTENFSQKENWDNIQSISIDTSENKITLNMKAASCFNSWLLVDCPIIPETYFDKQKILSHYSINQLQDSAFINKHQDIKQWAQEFNSPKYSSDIKFMNGCGPYKITKWDKGISIMLEKKKNHWSNNLEDKWFFKSFPEKIIFKINGDNGSSLLELKNGLIDVSTVIDFSSFLTLSKDKTFTSNYITKLAETYNYLYIAMNMKPDGKNHKKLFNDINVRKAIALSTPYEQLNKLVYENTNTRAIGPVSKFKFEFNGDLEPIPYDLTKAKEILKNAGWKDSDNDQILDKKIDGEFIKLEFDINFLSTQKQWENIAKQLAESYSKMGIFAKLNPLDYTAFLNAGVNHDFDMMIGSWQTTSQPDNFFQLWHSNSWLNNGLNFTGFGNSYSDALIDSINKSTDENIRITLSKKFQKLVYDEQPYVFLFNQSRRVIVNKKWENLEIYREYPGVLLNTLKQK